MFLLLLASLLITTANGQTCQNYWMFYKDHLVYGSNTNYAGITSIASCLTQCLSVGNCYAVDMNFNIPDCWAHLNTPLTTAPASFTDRYHFRRDCSTSTTCTRDFWHLYLDTSVTTGGNVVAAATTITACINACSANGACEGYTWTGSQCYIFPTAVPAPTAGNSAGAYHFRRCDAVTGSPPPVTSGCDTNFWVYYSNSLIPGSNTQLSATTAETCRAACAAHSPTCYAVDFNKGSNTCWGHITIQTAAPSTFNNVDHVRRLCNGSPVCALDHWYLYENTQVSGGTIANGVSNEDTCRTTCEASSTCVAFNFVVNICYLFHNGIPTFTAGGTNNARFYKRCNAQTTTATPAPPSGNQCTLDYYIMYDNYLVFGGTSLTGTTEATCMTNCKAASPQCYAFDWDPTTSTCYQHTGYYLTGLPTPFNNRRHYRFLCDSSLQCDNSYWEIYPNKAIGTGGTVHSTSTTRDACRTACASTLTGCVAFDFIGTTCTYFTNPSAVPTTTNTGAIHERRCNAAPTTPAPAPPPPSTNQCTRSYYIMFVNKLVSGGSLISGATTRLACMKACLANTAGPCVAMDFDLTTNTCYQHTGSNLVGLPSSFSNREHYRFLCDASMICSRAYFEVYLDLKTGGGTTNSAATTLDACRVACMASSTCVAFDFIGTTCNLIDNTSGIPTTADTTAVHYRYCDATAVFPTIVPNPFVGPTGVPSTWQAYPSVQIEGGYGIPIAGMSNMLRTGITYDQCEQFCSGFTASAATGSATQCYSLDYNVDWGTCHLHLTTVQNCGTLVPAPAVYHVKKTGCSNSGYPVAPYTAP